MTRDSLFSWLAWALAFSGWLTLILSLGPRTKEFQPQNNDADGLQDSYSQPPKAAFASVGLQTSFKIIAYLACLSGLLLLACGWCPAVKLGYVTNFLSLAAFIVLCLGTVAAAISAVSSPTVFSTRDNFPGTSTSTNNQEQKSS